MAVTKVGLDRTPEVPSHDNRHLATLLVMTCVVLDTLIVSLGKSQVDAFTKALLLGFAFGQAGGVSAWLVFSSRAPVVRVLGLSGALLLLSHLCQTCSAPNWREWLVFLSGMVAIGAFPLAAAFRRGYRVYSRTAPPSQEGSLRRWQIPLASLFGLMTAVAILLGLFRWMRIPEFDNRYILGYILGFSFLGTSSVWLAVTDSQRLLRLLLVVIVAPLMGASAMFVHGIDPWPVLSGIATFTATTGTVGGLIVKMADFGIRSA